MHTTQIELPDNFRPHHKGLTHRDINQANEQFWSEQTILMHSRISDESLLGLALLHLMAEYSRGVPVRAQRPLENIFADFETVAILSHVKFSQKGGKKRKPDAPAPGIL